MNRRLVAFGIVLAVAGAALWYLPIEPTSAGTMDDKVHTYILQLDAPFDLLGASFSFHLTWSSSLPAIVQLYVCGAKPDCSNLTRSSYLTEGTGTSGTLSWQGKVGTYYALVSSIPPTPVVIDLHYPQPVLGGALGAAMVAFAGILIVLGTLFVRASVPRTRPAPATAEPTPTESEPEPQPPAPSPPA